MPHRVRAPATVNRSELETVMGGQATFDDLVASGNATLDGDRTAFDKLRTLLVTFTPDFEIMPGTVGEQPPALPADPFVQPEIGDTAGG